MTDLSKSNQVAKRETLAVSNGFNIEELHPINDKAILQEYFMTLLNSKMINAKSPEECFAVLQRTRELKLPFMTGAEHVHIIKGKTGVDVHILRALLLRAGTITWKCTKSYVPQYEYTDSNIGYKGHLPDYCIIVANKEAATKVPLGKVGVWICSYYKVKDVGIVPEYMLPEKHRVVNTTDETNKAIQEGYTPCFKVATTPYDYVTEYTFWRHRLINGKNEIHEVKSQYSYQDALKAGSLEKDTYKQHEKTMIGIRAFTLGAREIGGDLIQGCYETNELMEITGNRNKVRYSDSDLHVIEDTEYTDQVDE